MLAWQGEPLQGEETNNPRDALYNQQVSRATLSMPKPLVLPYASAIPKRPRRIWQRQRRGSASGESANA
ncbi:hypothetical protein P9302_17565 [Brevibacillus agri]|uniref:hypothetical protein n=1 Tax=Brevibacillus agri TaxID=51101 RepID=UPI0024BFB344|nr:hypothetical protein [Brevibacillus agri]MED4571273.1 hypothetical protein [Brevibacillus agri]WHX29031.1 hypothetical protein QNK09_18180 [Brevibacillus agri]